MNKEKRRAIKVAKRKVKSANHIEHKKTESLGIMRKINRETLLQKYNIK